MNKVERVSSLRAAVQAARKDKKVVGFVPTMGNLHEGHVELVRAAKLRAEFVVVSIFVNPTQFGDNEDFDNYPKTPEEDARLLAELGTDVLFLPSQHTLYPGDLKEQTSVIVPKLAQMYCGKDRPEHFDGVTTVVSRLFNMVQPDIAIFGNKDYQQLVLVRRMVNDLAYPIQVVGVDTVRNADGLALSSRNGYLSDKQLNSAATLYETLKWMKDELLAIGSVTSKAALAELENQAKSRLKKAGLKAKYISVCRKEDLKPAKKGSSELVILAAANIGKARLIDNIEITLTSG